MINEFIKGFLIDGLLVCGVGVLFIALMCYAIWKGMEKIDQ